MRLSILRRAIAVLVFCAAPLIATRAASAAPADGDHDGVSFGQEALDGTDPQNADSYIEHGDGTYCVEWNGYLSNMRQVAELRNGGCSAITMDVTLRDASGSTQSTGTISLDPSTENDLIINAIGGFQPNAYGTLCAHITSGPADALDLQLSAYTLSANSFGYAFAATSGPGRKGSQSLSYNHNFPTLNVFQLASAATAYVQISNEQQSDEEGELVFYDSEGNELRRENVTIPALGRNDVATHDIGANTIGTVEWDPSDVNAKFRLVLNRYYASTDSPDPYTAIASIPSERPSGALLSAPVSTVSRYAVVEISNTLNTAVTVASAVYDGTGALTIAQPGAIQIPAKGSRHLILNPYLINSRGLVQLQSNQPISIVAHLLEYQLNADLSLKAVNAPALRTGVGAFQKASYNNFLGACRLRLDNIDSVDHTTAITMTRADGTAVAISSPIQLLAHSGLDLDICGNETQTAYGAVSLQPSAQNVITGQLVRTSVGGNDLFVPLRERNDCSLTSLTFDVSPLQLTTGGATGDITIFNQSPFVTATNVTADFTGTALAGNVTVTGNTCASIPPNGSCTLTFTPGNNGVADTSFSVKGTNTLATHPEITITATTTLSLSTSNLALSVVGLTDENNRPSGVPRRFILLNTGSVAATNLLVQLPIMPAGALASSTCTTTLAAGSSCDITFVPGSVPSSASGVTNPAPLAVVVTADNASTLHANVEILTFGSVYQGGYVFSIDDSTIGTGSIAGKTAALTDNSTDWSSGFTLTNASSETDGVANTAIMAGQTDVAPVCINYQIDSAGNSPCVIGNDCYSDWYVPAICELAETDAGATLCPLGMGNIQANLFMPGGFNFVPGNLYWSSSESGGTPTLFVQVLVTSLGSSGASNTAKTSIQNVRCTRKFLP